MPVAPQKRPHRGEAAAAKKPARSFWEEEADPQGVQRLRRREAMKTRPELVFTRAYLGQRECLGERRKPGDQR